LYGSRNNQSPSRFLSEIPQRLIYKEVKPVKKNLLGRKVVQDWEVEKESANDFNEIDSW